MTRTRGTVARHRTALKKSVAAIPPGPRARGAGKLRAVDHVDVAIDDDGVAMRDMSQSALDRTLDAIEAHLADGDDEVARLDGIVVHLRLLAKLARPT